MAQHRQGWGSLSAPGESGNHAPQGTAHTIHHWPMREWPERADDVAAVAGGRDARGRTLVSNLKLWPAPPSLHQPQPAP